MPPSLQWNSRSAVERQWAAAAAAMATRIKLPQNDPAARTRPQAAPPIPDLAGKRGGISPDSRFGRNRESGFALRVYFNASGIGMRPEARELDRCACRLGLSSLPDGSACQCQRTLTGIKPAPTHLAPGLTTQLTRTQIDIWTRARNPRSPAPIRRGSGSTPTPSPDLPGIGAQPPIPGKSGVPCPDLDSTSQHSTWKARAYSYF